jgi:hypothetical protein
MMRDRFMVRDGEMTVDFCCSRGRVRGTSFGNLGPLGPCFTNLPNMTLSRAFKSP